MVGFCVLVVAISMLAAWVIAVSMLIDAMEAKGYTPKNKGALWFVGIFASPVVLGLYVVALPPADQQKG